MKKNVGKIDKILRIIVAIGLILLFAFNVVSGLLGIIFLVLAIVFLLTSIFNFCPLYTIFGINSCSRKS